MNDKKKLVTHLGWDTICMVVSGRNMNQGKKSEQKMKVMHSKMLFQSKWKY